MFTYYLEVDCVLICGSILPVAVAAQELGVFEVVTPAGATVAETNQLSYRVEADRRHYYDLEDYNKTYASKKLPCSILVLQPSQETRKKEHHTGLDGQSKREEKSSRKRSVDTDKIEAYGNIQSHNGVIEKILIKFTHLFVGEEHEADHLSLPGSIFVVRICNLGHIVVDA